MRARQVRLGAHFADPLNSRRRSLAFAVAECDGNTDGAVNEHGEREALVAVVTGLTDLIDEANMHGSARLVDTGDVCGANPNATGYDSCWLCTHDNVTCRHEDQFSGKLQSKAINKIISEILPVRWHLGLFGRLSLDWLEIEAHPHMLQLRQVTLVVGQIVRWVSAGHDHGSNISVISETFHACTFVNTANQSRHYLCACSSKAMITLKPNTSIHDTSSCMHE
jgi:hypothetical protein